MKIIGFLNSYCDGLSGGDTRFIEILKRLGIKDIQIVTSTLGKQMYEQFNFKSRYIITSNENTFSKVIPTYLIRIINALIHQSKIKIYYDDIIYSSSDFLPDIIPAFALKCKNFRSKWIVCIFLIVPSPRREYIWRFYPSKYQKKVFNPNLILYYLSQQVCIHLAKHWAHKILVMNYIDKTYLIERKNIPATKIEIAYGGVNFKYTDSIKSDVKEYEGIFLARFHQQKGIFDLIDIWEKVCKEIPHAKLCIIGSGPKEFVVSIKKHIADKKLEDNIELKGAITIHEKKVQLLKSGKIFIYPSYYESFGIVLVEAMACKLPIIAYDLPVYKETFGNTIKYVPIGDIQYFSEVVVALLKNDDTQKEIGELGRMYAEKTFDWDNLVITEKKILGIERVRDD